MAGIHQKVEDVTFDEINVYAIVNVNELEKKITVSVDFFKGFNFFPDSSLYWEMKPGLRENM